MRSLRGERLSAEYQKAVYEVISTKLKTKTDRIRGIVSVTKADVSPDLKNAKIYISVLAKNKEEARQTFDAICEHAATIRYELAHDAHAHRARTALFVGRYDGIRRQDRPPDQRDP